MTKGIADQVAGLAAEPFEASAVWAAARLKATGSAVVELAPGDYTSYRLAFVSRSTFWAEDCEVGYGRGYIVSCFSSFSHRCELWDGTRDGADLGNISALLACGDTWATPSHEYTAAVIARFLERLADHL